jgi:hypothetical protein
MITIRRRALAAVTCLALAIAPTFAQAGAKVVEGDAFPIRLEEALSSKTAQEGQRFSIILDDDVTLGDGTVLRAGYRGVGEIVDAKKNGMMGKSGKLSVRLEYLRIGDQRIRLRGQKAAAGDHRTGTQIVGVVLVGVFAGFIKGKNTTIPKGARITAFADQDLDLTTPVPAPPADI